MCRDFDVLFRGASLIAGKPVAENGEWLPDEPCFAAIIPVRVDGRFL
jgi:hypothetical protein